MPKYKVGITRRPTSVSFSMYSVTAKTPEEAMQKAQQSYKQDIMLKAEPTAFRVDIARKPTHADRYVDIDAYNPLDAKQKIERAHHGMVAMEILEVKALTTTGNR